MKKTLLLLSLFFLFSCSKNTNYFYKALDYKPKFEPKDIGKENSLNDDNIIFKTNYTFLYTYEILDSIGKTLNCLIYHDTILKTPGWNLIYKQKKNEDKNVTLDKIKLTVFANDLSSFSDLGQEQTIIKYNYKGLFNQELWYGARTGVIEDSTQVFLHPPRAHCFVWTQIHPFPEVHFPLMVGDSWTSTINVPDYVYEEINRTYPSFPTFLEETHTVIGKEIIKTPLGKLDCFLTESISKDDKANYHAKTTHYFNETYGFVRIIYENNYHPYVMKLHLESVKTP